MGFLFSKRKLDREEFNQCLNYLEEHYKLTSFQEKEAGIYNAALTEYGPSLANDTNSARKMLKIAERFKKAGHMLLARSKQLVSVPESAVTLYFSWDIVFSDYTAWVDAQYAAYAAIAEGIPPFAEHVQSLFRQQEESFQKALQEEKKLLKLLISNGLTTSDIQRLRDNAFTAIEAENWQPDV